MRRTIPLAVVPLAISALLAGCSDQQQGSPTPAPSSSTASEPANTKPPSNGAPTVSTPLDISHFQQSPCDVLTTEQTEELFGTTVEPEPDVNAPPGPACNWHGSSATSVTVIFPDVYQGLGSIYQGKDAAAYFLELEPIEGYPTVAASKLADSRATGECRVVVGTSDTTTVEAQTQQSEENVGKKDPCQAARGVAEMAIRNIKGAN